MELAISILSSSAVSGALAAALIFLARTWISERLSNAIRNEYDQNLEAFKATIQAQQAIRDAGTTNFAATHRAAFDRRLDAIAAIWKCTMQLRYNTPVVLQIIDHLDEGKYNHFLQKARGNDAVCKEVGHETLTETLGPIVKEASELRPFVGEYLYALFDVYQSLIIFAASLLHAHIERGTGLPWHSGTLDNLFASFMTTEELEELRSQQFKLEWARKTIERKMVEHARNIVSGQESGDMAVSQSKRIEEAVLKAQHEARVVNKDVA